MSRASASSTRWTSWALTSTYSVQTIKDKLGATPLVVELPIGAENDFVGVVDLIRMKAYVWNDVKDDMGAHYDTVDIPADLQDKAEQYRAELLDMVAESDEELLEKYLESGELSEDEIRAGIRKLTVAREAYPVLCGSAFKDKGVQPMLDARGRLPAEPGGRAVHRRLRPEGRVHRDRPQAGHLRSVLGSGLQDLDPPVLRQARVRAPCTPAPSSPATTCSIPPRGKKERVGKIFQMHADKENPVDGASAGNIYTFVGLKNVSTGDTLCDEKAPISLESMTFPDPVIEVAVEPKTKGDQEKMGIALAKLSDEDPTFQVKTDEESGQTLISGMGELQLDIIVDRLRREFKVECNVGKPQVAYRETIRKAVMNQEYTHKKQTGGSGQFAKVLMNFEPLDTENGETYEFHNEVTGGHITKEFIPSIDAGVQEAMESGVLAGFPVVGVKATVTDGQTHDVDSSEMAFKIAGSMCFKEAAPKAHPVILEPIMAVEVRTPEEYMGDVMGDLNARRGQIQSMTDATGVKVIDAKVPLSEMFGYIGDLRSKTQGRAMFTMQMDSYAEVPKNVSDEIIKAQRGE